MQKTEKQTGLVWFRNDLRIQDQQSLKEAVIDNQRVIACYCFDPRHFEVGRFGFKKTEKFRAKFLVETVQNLKTNLNALGIELFVYHNHPENVIPNLVEEFGVSKIFLQKEWTQEEMEVSQLLKQALPDSIKFIETYDQFLFHPEDIEMDVKDIPKVFTNFRKHLEKKSTVRKTLRAPGYSSEENLENNTTIPSLSDLALEPFEVHPHSAFPFKGGEDEVIKRLDHYFFETKKLAVYKKTRNGLVGIDYSSKFSPWLANGSISPRIIYWKVKEFEEKHQKNDSTYWLIFELIWRDFFKYISLKHGNNIFQIEGILDKDYDWNQDQKKIQSWINGKTDEDFVNANMIEFKKTGWMSNRGRQNVASFFAKELFVDWRIGASYFESLLLDYDVHSNYGNWMYVAGVGNDPRDRKFNISSQAERYDTQGKYRQLWLQETLF